MKIELELPYVDEELSIKITVKKDGEVVVDNKPAATPATPKKPAAQPKKKTTTPTGSGTTNFMNADF